MKAMNGPMWHEYQEVQSQLYAHHPGLKRVHPKNPFCCTTVNFGPQTVCRAHLDHGNRAGGWCVISAWGSFDPTRGGHIVLWNLGLIVEFPARSSVFIPSALVPHSNTLVQPGETRYSVTSWTASGIFRWVYNRFKTDKQWEETATEEDRERRREEGKARWAESLKLFPRLKLPVTACT